MADIEWSNYIALGIEYGTKVILFGFGVFATWVAAGWVRRIAYRSMQKADLDKALSIFISKLIRWIVIVFGVVTLLGMFGVETASFAAALAGAGLAIGMALQGTLGNFAAGVMLLLFRPFKIGDVVKIAGQMGIVAEIDILSTVIDTYDNRRIIVPNGNVFGNLIENLSYHSERRVDVIVGTEYDSDIDEARKTLFRAIGSVDEVLKSPEPQVALTGLGESSIDWAVRAWVHTDDYWSVKDKLTKAVKNELDAKEIGIPFPQRDLHFKSKLIDKITSSKQFE